MQILDTDQGSDTHLILLAVVEIPSFIQKRASEKSARSSGRYFA